MYIYIYINMYINTNTCIHIKIHVYQFIFLSYLPFVLGAVKVELGIHFGVDHFRKHNVEFVARLTVAIEHNIKHAAPHTNVSGIWAFFLQKHRALFAET